MPANNKASNNRKAQLRNEQRVCSEQALRIPTKVVLQGSILIETPDTAQLYVPVDRFEQAKAELGRNFHYTFDTQLTHVWSNEEERMMTYGRIDLPEYIAKPVKDGIAKDTIKFASTYEAGKQMDIDATLTGIVDLRLRQKA